MIPCVWEMYNIIDEERIIDTRRMGNVPLLVQSGYPGWVGVCVGHFLHTLVNRSFYNRFRFHESKLCALFI